MVLLRTHQRNTGDSSMPAQGSSNANPEIQDLSGTGDKHGGLTSNIGHKRKIGQSGELTNQGTTPNYEGGRYRFCCWSV